MEEWNGMEQNGNGMEFRAFLGIPCIFGTSCNNDSSLAFV